MGDDLDRIEASTDKSTPCCRQLDASLLRSYVTDFLDRRKDFLDVGSRYGSPLYLIDKDALISRAGQFRAAFGGKLANVKFYYAMKSNNHPDISKILLRHGYGLDVSSGCELAQALDLKADDIIFSGPGKTAGELLLAAENGEKVTVLIDSFGELDRLEAVAVQTNRTIRAGVRLCVNEKGLWRKFGIPLAQLRSFLKKSESTTHVRLCGLQFHVSWNLDSVAQVEFLSRLGNEMSRLDKDIIRNLEFIDIGGGYWPPSGEWLQSRSSTSPENDSPAGGGDHRMSHFCNPAVAIETFAEDISLAIDDYIGPHFGGTFCLEPGRWLCHDAMHVLLTVVDKKADDLVITDGGTNAVGWERFETDYFPVINLSRPGLTERPCMIAGSLCTPHDLWGYAYFGESIEPGDTLLVPSQGAYTYSMRQHFIKDLPAVAIMEKDGDRETDNMKGENGHIRERIKAQIPNHPPNWV